ncbi:MAG: TonB-dependent receptor plug domain-containing protein [Gammaproteobacteria bacterium]|nr:TonB-dependent receptor plug domain-containing protein [Gammaproteobacteria bacterium]MYF58771.1 TonB-dependent receptor plug domain-containing protein [Gammaproteobacteria bacterium]
MRKILLVLTAVSIPFLIADITVAQDSTAVLEEIVVTAQKREESLADVGIAVDVISGDRLREAGALSLIEVGRFSPGLNIQTPFGEFGYPLIAIRGVNTDGFIETLPQSTGVYADGVYVSQPPMQAFRLLDLERMEVLKGPQGTIYGRNTIAGAINLISKRPTFEPEGYATVGFGNYSRASFEGAYGGPISDTAAGRIAVKYLRQTDSPLTNLDPNLDDGGELDQLMARGSLLFRPNDDVELLVRFYAGRDDSDVWPWAAIPAGQDTDGDGIPDQVCPEYARGDVAAAQVNCLARDPFVSGDTFNDTDGDPYTINQNAIGNHAYRSSGISAELNWSLSQMTLTSVTGLDDFERHDILDEDAGPTVALDDVRKSDVSQFSQEVRLASNAGDGMQWLAGIYYSSDEMEGDPSFDSGGRQDYSTLETDTLGLFGQIEYPLSADLALTVGGRWTDVQRDFDYRTTGFFASAELQAGASSSFSDSDYSARVALDWSYNDNTLIYASISRGFNAGTFNSQFLATVDNLEPTKSESLTAYEVGLKSTFAGGRASVEAAVYYYDATDPQVVAVEPLSLISANFLINADDSKMQGGEIQLRALAADWLELSFGAAYIDSEYGNLVTSVAGTGTGSPYPDNAPVFGSTLADLTGNRIPNTPELSINSSATVEWPVNDGWRFIGQLDFLWEDDIPRDLRASPALFTEAHIDVDLRLAVRSADDKWDAAFWVRNLTDEEYLTEAYEVLGFGFYIAAGNYSYPRTFGLELTRRF